MDDVLLGALNDGVLVVARDARLARQLRWQYTRQRRTTGDQAWVSPQVTTWEAWTRTLAEDVLWSGYSSSRGPRSLLSPAQENALWEQIIATSGVDGLLNIAATARTAREAWGLVQRWRLPDPGRQDNPTPECREFSRWMRAYHERCNDAAWLDGARLLDTLTPAVRAGAARSAGSILLAGFDAFDPQQRGFLKALENTGVRLAMHKPPNRIHDARRVGFDGAADEINAMAAWVHDKLHSEHDPRIGVVVPDIDAMRLELTRVFDEILIPHSTLPGVYPDARPYHLAGGIPLADCPVVRSAVKILALNRDRVAIDDVSAVLRSPFCAGAAGEGSQRAQFDIWLREQGFWEVPTARLADLSERFRQQHDDGQKGETLHTGFRLFATAPILRQKNADASSWARHFRAVLDAFGWPGDAHLSPRETAVTEAFRELNAEFAGLDAVRVLMTPGAAVERLRRLAGETRFRYRAADAAVQVMDPARAAGLSFDHLWIGGMDDEAWPPAPNPNPFLPIDWQRDRGMPGASASGVLEAAQLATGRLLADSDDVIVSWVRRRDDRAFEVSPLYAGLSRIERDKLALAVAGERWQARRPQIDLETLHDVTAPPLEGIESVRGGTQIFSLQAACPFRAFAQLRLGARRIEQPQPGLSAANRGELLHLGLEYIWNRLGSHELLGVALKGEHLEMQVWEVTETAIAVFGRRRAAPVSQRLHELERSRLIRLIMAWLRHENGRAPFEVIASEQERDLSLGGVEIRIRIDRIDRIDGHGLAIIDYKTGQKPTPGDWFSDRPDGPQLPLYALAENEPLAAVLYAHVKSGESAFIGVAADDGWVPGVRTVDKTRAAKAHNLAWKDLSGYWRQVLERIGRQFAAGDAAVDPKKGAVTCRFCHLQAVCRIAEQREASAVIDNE